MLKTCTQRIWGSAKPALVLAGLFLSFMSGFMSMAKAETLQSVTFRVPLDVSHIHKDIKFLAPMCRIFTGDVTSNANQLGAVRPDIPVPASRKVSQKISMTITKANLSPGKSLDDATLYSCTLYVKKSARGPLLTYAVSHPDLAIRALGKAPRNIVTGAVKRGRGKEILIHTAQLRAKGTYGIVSKPLADIPTRRAAGVDIQRVEGVRGSNKPADSGRDLSPSIDRGNAQILTPSIGVVADQSPLGPAPVVTGWAPLEAARPGQLLVIEGRDFMPGSFVLQLQGDNGRAINLRIKNATPSRIEAEITDMDYTGEDGARLVAFHRNGRQKILDTDYKILGGNVSFSGSNIWSLSTHPLGYFISAGDVTLTLNRFESASNGTGVLQENVMMVRQSGIRYVACQKRGVSNEGVRRVIETERELQDLENAVTWRKTSNGLVEINGTASFGLFSANGRIVNNRLTLEYAGPVPHVNAAEYTPFIADTPPEDCIIGGVPGGQQNAGNSDTHLDNIELRVEWNLRQTSP